MMNKNFLIVVFLIALTFSLSGCFNIFSPLFVDPSASDLSNEYDVSYLVEIGEYYADMGDYINAKRFFERALQINPTNSRALIGMANCEFFSIIPRTNFIDFFNKITSNTNTSNYLDFINVFIEDSKYYSASRVIRNNLYIILSGQSDNPKLSNDINVNLNFSLFNKIFSIFYALDSDKNNIVNTNDIVYKFLIEMTNSSDTDFIIPNDFLFFGREITKAIKEFFSLGLQSKKSLLYISNRLSSSENSLEVQLYKAFNEVDTQISNIYTNYTEKYTFYLDMYNRIIELLNKNGISNVNSIFDLTNALSITNYDTFDYTDITNILSTNDSAAWDILTNYLDINRLTNR